MMGTRLPETCWATIRREINNTKVASSWFFLSTLNYDARSTTHPNNVLLFFRRGNNFLLPKCPGRLWGAPHIFLIQYQMFFRRVPWGRTFGASSRLITFVIKIGRTKSKKLVDILLLRSCIHKAYLRNNYMFRPFSMPSSIWSYILFEATIQYGVLSL